MALSNVSKDVCEVLLKKLNENEIISNNELSNVKGQHANIAKLSVLYDQLKYVQKQIQEVIEDVNINAIINNVEMKCKKFVNQKYYLYRDLENDKLFFSRLSEKDYNYKNKDLYLGCYLLDLDYSWKKIEES